MATLAFAVAGQAVGGLLGGPIGATVGRALGALAGSVVDDSLFGTGEISTAGRDLRLQGSSEGGAVPRLYGWNRVAGNIIWATELERLEPASGGGKGTGGSSSEEDVIAANFAVAFCEGEVTHLGRIWADGQLLETNGLNVRFYRGAETQQADSLISAKQGAANTPAYRGLCYAVFERLPLTDFGNRIPQISMEICRGTGDLEPQIKAVTVIPGATEYGYDPAPRVRIVGPGRSAGENTHVLAGTPDWTLSIDELQSVCPNLEHVALVIAWFGTDLRCGTCTIEPRVESGDRQIKGQSWSVSGITRAGAAVVSQSEGGPAYGGTPADSAVLAAIADLKARGLKVTFYPMVLMDVPAGNSLTDPYTLATGQPPYPWRGRVTCHPAPGVAGSVDQSAAAAGQMADFVGDAASGYRRMILHYAHLCTQAGGVDAFLIGSEMRGLTQVRSDADTFPFVDALKALAGDVRAIAGANTKITYAADWSEYHGYQPPDAPGDKLFHLDPLWADADIDAVGIDNYMPVADWRDGTAHEDAAEANSIYELNYLGGNIAGGEGYDWFYADSAARTAQNRTPITDGTHGEPWVWRFKDLHGWWANAHHNRIGGVRQAATTGWVPKAKPFWFTELGCGAVDKGANLPSAFADPKSSEDARPYFSDGTPDLLMQRQFLRAHMRRWNESGDEFEGAWNPASDQYAGRMVDFDRIYLWTWDARPYPAFPALGEVWADAPNHATGHWLTGRLGQASGPELLMGLAEDYDVPLASVASPRLQVQGVQVDRLSAFREATETLLAACRLALRDRQGTLQAVLPESGTPILLDPENFVREEGPLLSIKRGDSGEVPGRVALTVQNRHREFQSMSVTAMARTGAAQQQVTANFCADETNAGLGAEHLLAAARQDEDVAEFALPPSMVALEVGDCVRFAGRQDGTFVITRIRDGATRRVTAQRRNPGHGITSWGSERLTVMPVPPAIATPTVFAAHLPPGAEPGSASRLAVGAYAAPWPGSVTLRDSTGGTIATLGRAATLGETGSVLMPAAADIWDWEQELQVSLYGGHLASAAGIDVLNGASRLAIEHAAGSWEIIGFAEAELTGTANYSLRGLLRGLAGTGPVPAAAPVGSRVMRLDGAVETLTAPETVLGASYQLTAHADVTDLDGTAVTAVLGLGAVSPLAPAHLHAERYSNGDVAIGWVRRSRRNGDNWALAGVSLDAVPETYRVTVVDSGLTVRTFEAASPAVTYTAAQQIADFGALPDGFSISVQQVSAVYGPGAAATGEFHDG